jgi:4-alpha-glucanotransferase
MSADPWSVTDGYEDSTGHWRATSPETREALLAAMGVEPATAPGPTSVRVLRPGDPLRERGELALEDGAVLKVDGALPEDVPFGYHELHRPGAAPVRVIVSPGRCHLPEGLRTWGWAVQLYAARSMESWGIGDLADLRRLARWSAAELGAGLLLVNPLHAAIPIVPQEPSPYYPSSRRYLNPLYLRIEEVPGAGAAGFEIEPLAAAGRELNGERRIERDAAFDLKQRALETIWRRHGRRLRDGGEPRFDRYRAEQGDALRRFATYCVLAEHHRCGWRGWPSEHRRPDAPAVARFAADREDRVQFHAWLQWLLDDQLAGAAREIGLTQDLPIGAHPDGADAWTWQDVLATDASVGAPPDRFVKHGQDWGLPPFIPHRLRAARYEPFIQTIRSALRHARGLRIDHVMGLFRQFWVPKGRRPVEGGFVRYPADDLLGIVALESVRAKALIVGEDLGTVEAGVRERLHACRILSYRVLWFETAPPADYPELALAGVGTHDLPTIAGLWTGADVRAQRDAGLEPNEAAAQATRARLAALTGLALDAPAADVVEQTYRALATAPSVALTGTLDDALEVEERPNMPSTTTQWPNWSLALPAPLETIERTPLARRIAAALTRR